MREGNNTVTCIVYCKGSAKYNLGPFTTHIQRIFRSTAMYFDFKFQTPKWNTGSTGTSWTMTFTFQHKAQILSECHQNRLLLFTLRCAHQILQKSPPKNSDLI